jgi:hypothetical protein
LATLQIRRRIVRAEVSTFFHFMVNVCSSPVPRKSNTPSLG